MDLDNIKKAWQETEIQSSVTDQRIQQMIDNKGKSAFNSLLRYEKIGVAALICCIALSFVFRDKWAIGVYLITIALAIPWQLYKIKFLKKFDFATMNILETSNRLSRYKKYLIGEVFIGFIWAFAFMAFSVYRSMYLTNNIPLSTVLIMYALMMSLFTISILILYKYMYMNNIKSIQKAIDEVKYFEQDND